MDKKKEDIITGLIKLISPHAKEYVQNAFVNGNVDILYFNETSVNKGVFLMIKASDFDVFYAAFPDGCGEEVLDIIRNRTQELLLKDISKEICFNVYGRNEDIIKLVREMGFKSDMEGFHMEYSFNEPPVLKDTDLVEKRFENNRIGDYTRLFDMAYYSLNLDNGWKTNYYQANAELFSKKFSDLEKLDQIHSFWLNDNLVGAYITIDNYIADLVVNPHYQNKGYGSYILSHCISSMMINRGIEKVRLRVARSNTGARRLYERNGFKEIACFAEHTFIR